MTLDEVNAQLRDIHLPPAAHEGLGFTFAIWPLAVFAAICFAVLLVATWRRSQGRREARAELRRIRADSNPLHQWPALLALALEISRLCAYRHPLPEVAFRAPDTLTTADVAALAAHVKGVIRL